MGRLPDFLIIGAMKSATTTLYEQLSRQPGIFLPELKEPNFFSNDEQYARGTNWYADLFHAARDSDIIGEASTHYSKLPTYPETVDRMLDLLTSPRLIYVIRHPIDRLVSQYIHQWSEGEISCGLEDAIARHPELVSYSCYSRQLQPYVEAFGKDSIMLVHFDRIIDNAERELHRVCRFIDYRGHVTWHPEASRRNVSRERIRKFPLYDMLVESEIATRLRRGIVPRAVRTRIRHFFSMRQRPVLSETTRKDLEDVFDEDLAILGHWFGCHLDCQTFCAVTSAKSLYWK